MESTDKERSPLEIQFEELYRPVRDVDADKIAFFHTGYRSTLANLEVIGVGQTNGAGENGNPHYFQDRSPERPRNNTG
jgi:hypothetical protein